MSLASITSGKRLKPPRIGLYGTPGIGKSTLAACAPNPIFIQTEEGTDTIDTSRFPLATSFADVIAHLDALGSEHHDYETVVIDSLDWLEKLIHRQVATDQGKKSIEEIGFAKGYTFALDHWRQVLDRLTALRDHKNMLVVLIAHAQIKRFDPPEVDPYDRYQPRLHEKATGMVLEWCDAFLFANYRVFTRTVGEGFDKSTRAVGSGERTVFTTERPTHLAKNRYSLPSELPLAWDAIISAIAASAAPALAQASA